MDAMTEKAESIIEIERLVAENVSEATWLRLRRLTSSVLCRRILLKRAPSLNAETIENKANQTAWAVRSALGYWETSRHSQYAGTDEASCRTQ